MIDMRRFVHVRVIDYERHFEQVVAFDQTLFLRIEPGGSVYFIEFDKRCTKCDGKGGIAYFFAQDDRRDVACPVCNNGSLKRWDDLAARWQEHLKASR